MKLTPVLIVYAVLVLGAGAFAYFTAPPEANKVTAIAIPGAIALIAGGLGLAWCTSTITPGKRLAALVMCLLFGALVAYPAVKRTMGMRHWPDASAAWAATIALDPALAEKAKADPAARKTFFKDRNSPDYDQTKLLIALWSITGLSVVAAALVGMVRTEPVAPAAP